MPGRSSRPRPINTAPRDGTSVRLWIASAPEPVLAHWSRQMEGWLRDDDAERRVLHGVTGWAPHASAPAQPTGIAQARKTSRQRTPSRPRK